jgi:hypothetical protein
MSRKAKQKNMKIKLITLLFFTAIIFTSNSFSTKTSSENTILTDLQNKKEKITHQQPLQPNREQMLNDLNMLYRKMSNRKFEEVKKFLNFPSSASQEEIEIQIIRSIENNEISAEGIAILSEKGSFGKLRDIFPEKADKWLERSEIKNEGDCFAIKLNQAEVAGLWNGENFVFFRLDDVGKLAMPQTE